MLKEAGHISNTAVLTINTLRHIQYLHWMYSEVAWILISSETQVQPQIIVDSDNFPYYPSFSYECDKDKTFSEK